MKRLCAAALVLAIPLLGGFECEVSVSPWSIGEPCTPGGYNDFVCEADDVLYCTDAGVIAAEDCAAYCTGGYCGYDIYGYAWCECPDIALPGDPCDYWTDYPASTACYGLNSALVCGDDGYWFEWDCTTACPSGVYGYCAYDSGQGNDWCMCEEDLWAPGYPCDYATEFDDATCDTTGEWLTYCAETNIIGEINCYDQCEAWYGAGTVGYCDIQAETGYNGCVCEYTGCGHSGYCFDYLWHVYCDIDAEVWEDCNAICLADGAYGGWCDLGGTEDCLCSYP